SRSTPPGCSTSPSLPTARPWPRRTPTARSASGRYRRGSPWAAGRPTRGRCTASPSPPKDGNWLRPATTTPPSCGTCRLSAPSSCRPPGRPAGAAPAPASPSATAPAARPTPQEVVLVGGMPAGGKTTCVEALTGRGYSRLNRDTLGGKVDDLLPRLEQLLAA